MSASTQKATVNPKKRITTTVLIAIYTALAIFSAIMGIYDLATDKRLFGILFLVASLIFFVLMLIKGNSVFGTHLKIKGSTLYMKSWDNGFLPYNVDGGFLSDLKPSKTKVVSVPIEDITTILIGSKDYVKRNMTESGKRFIKALYPYEHSSKKAKRNMVMGLDMFYLETADGDCSFMCVEDYSVKNVVAVINEIYTINPSVTIKVNNREYRQYVKKQQEEA